MYTGINSIYEQTVYCSSESAVTVIVPYVAGFPRYQGLFHGQMQPDHLKYIVLNTYMYVYVCIKHQISLKLSVNLMYCFLLYLKNNNLLIPV